MWTAFPPKKPFPPRQGVAPNQPSPYSGGDWRHRDHLVDSPDIRRQLERLILPDQMGTLFKALAIVPKSAPTPPGF